MIQDSINQMLGTIALGSRLASDSIGASRAGKMAQLQQDQQKAFRQLDPTKLEAIVDPKGKIEKAENIQAEINKLGNRKIFPNTKLAMQAMESKGATEDTIQNFKQGFSAPARKGLGVQFPEEIAAEQAKQRALQAIHARANQAYEFKQHKGFIGGYRDEAMGGK